MKLFLIRVLFALVLLCSPVFAATYYVCSTDGDNGDNGTTTGLAWATIGYAIDKINDTTVDDGDTVSVCYGHTENASFNGGPWKEIENSGSSGSGYITLQSDSGYGSGGKPKITRSTGTDNDDLLLICADYVKFIGFELDCNGPTRGCSGITVGCVDGTPPGSYVDHVTVSENYIHDVQYSTSYCAALTVGGTPGADTITVEDNIIENWGSWGLNIYPFEVKNSIFRGNKITNSNTTMSADGATGCIQYQNWGSDNTIEYNYCQDVGSDQGGIVTLHKYGTTTHTGNIVRYNYVEGPGGTNYAYGISLIGDSGQGGNITADINFYGNIVTGWKGSGFHVGDGGLQWAGGTINFDNNTLYDNAKGSDGPGGTYPWGEVTIEDGDNLTVTLRNNIIVATDDQAPAVYVRSYFSGTFTAYNNNLLYHTLNSGNDDEWGVYQDSGTDYYILSSGSQGVTDWEATTQNTSPDFVAAGTDFSVNSGSPAIDNGADLGSSNGLTGVVKSDWVSQNVTLSNLLARDPSWDIGAYESASTALPVMKGMRIGKND